MTTGRVYEVSPTTTTPLMSKGYVRLVIGQTYRVTAEVRQTVAPAGAAKNVFAVELWGLDANFNPVAIDEVHVNVAGSTASPASVGVTDGWVTLAADITINAANTATYARSRLVMTGLASSTVQVARLQIEDVSQSAIAYAQAQAAATSASMASSSESAAGISANSATTAANTASSSLSIIQGDIITQIPDRVSTLTYFTSAYTTKASPTASAALSGGTIVSNSTEGNVYQNTAFKAIATRGMLAVSTGKTFRVDSRSRVVSGGAGYSRRLSFVCYASDYTYLGEVSLVDETTSTSTSFANQTLDTTSAAILAQFPTAAFVRAKWQILNGSSPTWQIAYLKFRDITDLQAATNAASAAANSASSANNAVTDAESAASASQTSATNAASAYSAANIVTASMFPEKYMEVGSFFTTDTVGSPQNAVDAPSNASAAGFGLVRDIALVANGNQHWLTRATLPATAGRIYKIEIEFELQNIVGSATNSRVEVALFGLDGAYAAVASQLVGSVVPNGTIQTTSVLISNVAQSGVLAWPSGANLRVGAKATAGAALTSGTFRMRRLKVTDETERFNAALSASQASTYRNEASNARDSALSAEANAAIHEGLAVTASRNAAATSFPQFLYDPVNFVDATVTGTNPATLAIPSILAAPITSTVAGEGLVVHLESSASLATRGWMRLGTDKKFRLTIRAAVNAGKTLVPKIFLYDSNGAKVGEYSFSAIQSDDMWHSGGGEVANAALVAISGSAVYARGGFSETSGVGSVNWVRVSTCLFEDISIAAAAALSAAAAANSYTTADARANAADASSVAASGSALLAGNVASRLGTDIPNAATWTNSTTGSPETAADLTTAITTAAGGEKYISLGNSIRVSKKNVVPVLTNNWYEVTVDVGVGTASPGTFFVGVWNLDGQYASISGTAYTRVSKSITGRTIIRERFQASAGAVYLRAYVEGAASTSNSPKIYSMKIENITTLQLTEDKLGAAVLAASQASDYRDQAGSSASAASSSATNAATVFTNTSSLRAGQFPEKFDGLGEYFTSGGASGSPDEVTLLQSNAIAPDYGPVYEFTSTSSTAVSIATRSVLVAEPGRVYEVELEFQMTNLSGTIGSAVVGPKMLGMDGSYTSINPTAAGSVAVTPNGSIQVVKTRFSDVADALNGVEAWNAGSVYLRPRFKFSGWTTYSTLTIQIRRFKVTDVTQAHNAYKSAASAATSASSASQAVTDANGAKTSAETASGIAVSASYAASATALPSIVAIRDNFVASTAGSPYNAVTSPYLLTGSVVADTTAGDVVQLSTTGYFTTRGWISLGALNTFRVQIKAKVPSGSVASPKFSVYSATGARLGEVSGAATITADNTWRTAVLVKTTDDILAAYPTAVYIRGGCDLTIAASSSIRVATVELKDITSETEAAKSASAAAGSATTASAAAGTAGEHADAANQSYLDANVAYGGANQAKLDAVQAKNDAAGFSSTASSSANLASGYATSAFDTTKQLFPSGFARNGLYWSLNGATGERPTTIADSNFTTVAGIGVVFQNNAQQVIHPQGYITPISGRRYRITAICRVTVNKTAGASTVTAQWSSAMDASFAASTPIQGTVSTPAGMVSTKTAPTTTDDWFTVSADFVPNSTPNPYIRPSLAINQTSGNATIQVRSILIEDVTAAYQAAASATAANDTLTTVNTRADAAGVSASTATTAALTAKINMLQTAASRIRAETYTSQQTGSPETVTDLTVAGTTGDYYYDCGDNVSIYHKNVFALVAGRTYEITVEAGLSSASPAVVKTYLHMLTSTYTLAAGTPTLLCGTHTITARGYYTARLKIPAGQAGVWVRGGVAAQATSSNTPRIYGLWVRDLTSQVETEAQALAAAGSASTAATKASEAGQSASASQTSYLNALLMAQGLFPPTMDGGDDFWRNASGAAGDAAIINWTFEPDAVYGKLAVSAPVNTTIAPAGRVNVVAGGIWRIRVRFYTANASLYRMGLYSRDANEAVVSDNKQTNNLTSVAGWNTKTILIGASDVDPASVDLSLLSNVTTFRPHFRTNVSGAEVYKVAFFQVEEISSEVAAAQYASAASQTYSDITADFTGEGGYVSVIDGWKQEVSANLGDAQQAATNASTSATHASDSEVAAANSASSAASFAQTTFQPSSISPVTHSEAYIGRPWELADLGNIIVGQNNRNSVVLSMNGFGISTKSVIPAPAGSKFDIYADAIETGNAAGTGQYKLAVRWLDKDFNVLATYLLATYDATSTLTTVTTRIARPAQADIVYMRPSIVKSSTNSTTKNIQVYALYARDITSQDAAETSAGLASGSASTANNYMGQALDYKNLAAKYAFNAIAPTTVSANTHFVATGIFAAAGDPFTRPTPTMTTGDSGLPTIQLTAYNTGVWTNYALPVQAGDTVEIAYKAQSRGTGANATMLPYVDWLKSDYSLATGTFNAPVTITTSASVLTSRFVVPNDSTIAFARVGLVKTTDNTSAILAVYSISGRRATEVVAAEAQAKIATDNAALTTSNAASANSSASLAASFSTNKVFGWNFTTDGLNGWVFPAQVTNLGIATSAGLALTDSITNSFTNGATSGLNYNMGALRSRLINGNRVKVTVRARKATLSGYTGSSAIRVAFSTDTGQNSGWFNFSITSTMADYSFEFDVPLVDPLSSLNPNMYVGIEPSVEHTGLTAIRIAEVSVHIINDDFVDLRATVNENSGVLTTLQGRALAYWEVAANAGTSDAFVRVKAESQWGGGSSSEVAIGATEFHIFNPQGNSYAKALTVENGDVVVHGGLTANAYIRLGSGEGWPVALASRDFTVTDGSVVEFGTTLDSIPSIDIPTTGLDPLVSGETYNLYAENLTTSGCTIRLKIAVPGTPSSFNLTTSTAPGTGPTRQIDKSTDADSVSGDYTITCGGNWLIGNEANYETQGGGWFAGSEQLTLGVYSKQNGIWSKKVTKNVSVNGFPSSAATTYKTWSYSGTVNLGYSSTAPIQAVGVKIESFTHNYLNSDTPTLNTFSKLAWTAQGTASGTRSATPNGQNIRITVRPQ